MIEAWLGELVRGTFKLFLNPLFYWLFLLVIIAGVQRIKLERKNFGTKVFDVFTEWKGTWTTSIVSGLILSLLMLGAGFVFNYETVILWSIITILLSMLFRFSLLSAVYTLGATYIVLLFLPGTFSNLLQYEANFIGLAILIGLFLFIEAILISRVDRNETFPQLAVSSRGIWIGEHRLKRMAVIPFFLLLPAGSIVPFADYWPAISIGGDTYSLLLVPFVTGFDFLVKGRLPEEASRKISQVFMLLAVIVIAVAASAFWIPSLSLVAVLLAFIGREYISYRFRSGENKRLPFFHPSNDGLKVLAVIPGTPAHKIGVLVGETVVKVNGKEVRSADDFYEALQTNNANFKLDIINQEGEVRFVQGAFYETDHYQLGLLFPEEPHRQRKLE